MPYKLKRSKNKMQQSGIEMNHVASNLKNYGDQLEKYKEQFPEQTKADRAWFAENLANAARELLSIRWRLLNRPTTYNYMQHYSVTLLPKKRSKKPTSAPAVPEQVEVQA